MAESHGTLSFDLHPLEASASGFGNDPVKLLLSQGERKGTFVFQREDDPTPIEIEADSVEQAIQDLRDHFRNEEKLRMVEA